MAKTDVVDERTGDAVPREEVEPDEASSKS
jgi:hypothetical protein